MGENGPRMFQLHEIRDTSGAIGVFQPESMTTPMTLKRAYWLFDLKGGDQRGSHAHRDLVQVLVAIQGGFEIELDNGAGLKTKFHLNNATTALYLPSGYWREIEILEDDSILLVLASEEYDENDYFRNYDDFLSWKKAL